MQEVEVFTDGTVTMGPGTLYGAVKQMLGSGLIEESDVTTHTDDLHKHLYHLDAIALQSTIG